MNCEAHSSCLYPVLVQLMKVWGGCSSLTFPDLTRGEERGSLECQRLGFRSQEFSYSSLLVIKSGWWGWTEAAHTPPTP